MRYLVARGSRFALAGALLLFAGAAWAEIGPCVPDGTEGFGNNGLICGGGAGAARVIDGTISPDGSKALAWRVEGAPPTEQPDERDTIDLLVLRLKDGRILFKATTGYWDTGTKGRANRIYEYAAWSTDSRWLIESYDTRFETEALHLFAFDAKGEPSHELDLLPLIDRALREAARQVSGVKDLSFSVAIKPARSTLMDNGFYGLPDISIGRDGHARLKTFLWMPKYGPLHYYQVLLQLPGRPDEAASVLGVTRLKSEEAK